MKTQKRYHKRMSVPLLLQERFQETDWQMEKCRRPLFWSCLAGAYCYYIWQKCHSSILISELVKLHNTLVSFLKYSETFYEFLKCISKFWLFLLRSLYCQLPKALITALNIYQISHSDLIVNLNVSTAPVGKPCPFFQDLKWPITPLKKPIGSTVRGV